MRLLERNAAGEIRLTKDFLDDETPPYAILSHTWGGGEVLFKDLTDVFTALPEGTHKKLGYEKIRFCRDQTLRDGLQYFWVDTCCIDKANNVELQEAINSMFRWYSTAAKCYVYLGDVSAPATDTSSWELAFRSSRWFTRGWTLQELIAPAIVEFFSNGGVQLGTRSSLEQTIHEITGIPQSALRGSPLSGFSMSERMAWIEQRITTRKEDMAYSLMGILDIRMRIDYGEGREAAFRRLRAKIAKGSDSKHLLPLHIAENAAFDSRAEEHNARCHPDTRVALLGDIEAWASDPDGECIFWLNGVAGTGKSTISRTAASHFKQLGLLGASFFFKRGERDRGNATLLFTTLAAQLASKESQMREFIREALNSDPTIATKALGEQFEKLILQPLRQFRGGTQHQIYTLVVVIDALDECDHDNDIKRIIYLFSQMKALRSVRVRVFITSRPELPIRLGFKDISGRYQDVVLHQLPIPVIEHDISVYLGYELAKIRGDYNSQAFDQLPADWPGHDVIRTLVRMAVPLFIFAATVCRFIADEAWLDPEGQLARVLNYETNGDSELDKLSSTYRPVLDQLIARQPGTTRQSGTTKGRLINEFQTIVGPIVLLAEPLSARSLSLLLAFPIAALNRILNHLRAVLDVPSAADSPIRLFHLSFRDFLTESSRSANEFWVDEKKTHENLATSCIQRLGSHLKKDICNLTRPGKARIEIDTEDIDTFLPVHIQYACRYWVFHLEQSKERIRDGDHVHRFLTVHFLHWLEALSLIGKIAESIRMVNILRSLVEDGSAKLSAFLYDASRFILNCISCIDTAPLQVYCSAIIFAPKSSIIRGIFGIPKWIATVPDMEVDWSPCRQTLEGHNSSISSLAFAPNGILASGSEDETIKLWDPATGQCLATLQGYSGYISSLAFAPNGVLASGSNAIKLWDPATGQCLATLQGYGSYIKSLAFAPNGVLASGSDTIKLWDPATGQCLATLQGHSSYISSLAFAPNGMLASGSNRIKLWDPATRQCLATLQGHTSSISYLAFAPNGMLASGFYDKIKLWDLATKQCLATLQSHSDCNVSSLAFAPNGMLASGFYDNTIKLWDPATKQCLATLQSHSRYISSLAFAPNGMLASSSGDKTVKLWDLATKQCLATLQSHGSYISSLAFAPNGILVSGSKNKTIKLWDPATGQCLATLQGYSGYIAFAPNGVLASGSNAIKLWDPATGQCLTTLQSHSDCNVSSLAFAPNGMLASGSSDKTLKLWNPATRQCLATLQGHSGYIHSLAFAPNGVLASGSDRTVKLWDPATGLCLQTFTVGTTLYGLSFDSTSFCLHTDIGTFSLASSISPTQSSSLSSQLPSEPQQPTYEGYGISSAWIVWNSDNQLWLPPDYRPVCSAVAGSTIALGCASGQLLIFRFSGEPSV